MAKQQEVVVVLPGTGTGVTLPDGSKFKVAKQVTRTVLQQLNEVPFYIEITSSIHASTIDPEYSKYKNKDTGEASLPDVCDVTNLETGECQTLIVNAVLGSELNRHYPDDGYVGRSFGVLRTKSEVDKRYFTYKIIELERVMDARGHTVAVEKKNVIDNGEETVDKIKKERVKAA